MKKSISVFVMSVFGICMMQGFSLADGLDYVNINFCGTTDKTITYQTTPGTPVNICYNISNSYTEPQAVSVKFVDGALTNDQWKLRACKLDSYVTNFGQFVAGYDPIVTVGSGSTVNQNAILSLPTTSSGTVLGCLVYTLAPIGGVSGVGTSFTIQIRKSKFIDVNISSL